MPTLTHTEREGQLEALGRLLGSLIRRTALTCAARHGSVTVRTIQRELPSVGLQQVIRDLNALRRTGLLDSRVDMTAPRAQDRAVYTLTPGGQQAIRDLAVYLNDLANGLSATYMTIPQPSCQTTEGEGLHAGLEKSFREISGLPAVNRSPKGQD